jgi:phage-related baseplate assembly protein
MSLLDLARQANRDVLRALMSPGSDLNEIVLTIFHRQGNAFSGAEMANIKEFIGERLKGPLTVTVQNGTFTAVQIVSKVALLRGYTLNDIFNEAANRYTSLIDFRKLEFGTTLDSAELLSLLRDITGVGNVEDFTPSSDQVMADTSLPRFTSLKLTSLDNPGEIVSSDINQAY